MCSEELQVAIASNAQHGQSLIFLNRRGFAHFVHCLACGEPAACLACSVTLTLHRARQALVCHHCGATRPASLPCSHCGARAAHGRTPGTEQIEADLTRRFPALRIARMDRDSVGRRGAQARLLRAWHAGEIDVLIGTQMVTKGVDNPRVTLVGVLNADISLNLPDFRAAERTFQLVSQVAGRAGRGEAPGMVLVQTVRPNHYSLQSAAAHDYRAFFAAEVGYRRALGYPPFRRLINTRIEARVATTAERIARDFAARLRAQSSVGEDLEVLGPAPAPIERLRGWYRWQILVRGTNSATMRALLRRGLAEVAGQRQARRVRVIVDVDPYSML
jgi:primosomal protein N' (replication factor Y)